MPTDKSLYPSDWKERRERILERDGHKCKFCGVPNHIYVYRDANGWQHACLMTIEALAREDRKVTYIVLTIAHLIPDGPLDCPDEDLAALCQRCHLRYDIKKHVANAATTRRLNKEAAGQTCLLGTEGLSIT